MEFTLVFIMVVVAFLLTLIFGEEIGTLIKTVSLVVLIAPIVFFFIDGTAGMLSSNATSAQIIADSTTSKIIVYTVTQLPGIIMSDIAGALLGIALGLLARLAEVFQ